MYNFFVCLAGGVMRILFRIKINGKENIPKNGSLIICSNHVSNWDPVLLQWAISRRIIYMAKESLFKAFFVGFIMKKIKAIPVKRDGSDINAVKLALKTLKSDGCLGIFPTGQRQKVKGEGTVKSGVGLLALKTHSEVVPVHIIGNYGIFSKVIVNIGKPKVYSIPDGEKASGENAEKVSAQIYSDIKNLI